MTEQAHLRREQALSLAVDQVVHPDVVVRDVLTGLRSRLRDAQVYIGWNSFGEALREACFGPLPARPRRPVLETLVERSQREIQQHHERKLVLKEIIQHVGGRIVAANNFVEWKHRAEVEVRLLAELPVDLMHVAAKLFQQLSSRLNIVSSVTCSPAKLARTKSSKVAASPSSARQNSATCCNPRCGPLPLRIAVLRDQFPFHFATESFTHEGVASVAVAVLAAALSVEIGMGTSQE